MRLFWIALAALLVASCAGEDRRSTFPPTTRDGGVTVTPRDAGDSTRDAGQNPMGEVCSAFDMSQTCRCQPGQTCGAWQDGCMCIGEARDGGPPRDAGPGQQRDAGMQTPRDAGTQPPRDAGPRRDAGMPMPGIPTYSGGACPTLTDRNQGFGTIATPSGNREYLLSLPPNPNGAAVMFTWHWWMGQADQAMDWTGFTSLVGSNNLILVSFVTHPNAGGQWYNSGPPASNPDLQLFDDMLGCLYDQYGVDLDRVYATGHSMGGLFLSYLVQHRAQWIAAFSALSGGQIGGYSTPAWPLHGQIVWGGPTDTFGNFSFETASQTWSSNLRNDGAFVMHCIGDFGHQLPPTPVPSDMVWPFLRDHVRYQPSPYAGGLPPGTFPGWCSVP